MEDGLVQDRFGCRYCESTFKTPQSRTNHHAKFHKNQHKKMRYHRKAPNYPCDFCHIGFGSPGSKYNHKQRCLSNPDVEKQIKMMKKQNEKLKKEEKQLQQFVEVDENEQII